MLMHSLSILVNVNLENVKDTAILQNSKSSTFAIFLTALECVSEQLVSMYIGYKNSNNESGMISKWQMFSKNNSTLVCSRRVQCWHNYGISKLHVIISNCTQERDKGCKGINDGGYRFSVFLLNLTKCSLCLMERFSSTTLYEVESLEHGAKYIYILRILEELVAVLVGKLLRGKLGIGQSSVSSSARQMSGTK